MTKEERESLLKQIENIKNINPLSKRAGVLILDNYITVVPALLTVIDKIEVDRDQWKTHAEILKKTLQTDRSCNHAGKCRGCEVKQSECFSYMEFLVKKYEKLALQNACVSDELKADRDQWKSQAEILKSNIKSEKPCWACQRRNICDSFCKNECTELNKKFWQLDEARFSSKESMQK